jgi:two-component system sensor histidine kinase KdpD
VSSSIVTSRAVEERDKCIAGHSRLPRIAGLVRARRRGLQVLATHPAVAVFTGAAVGTAMVAVTTAVLTGAGADLTFASVTLLLVVVTASVLGYVAGLVAALAASAALTYYFTPPIHSFMIDQADDVLALVAFVAVSLLVGATVARLNDLRRRSELSAREAQIRLDVTNQLVDGVPAEAVLHVLARELVDLFGLESCELTAGRTRVRAVGTSMPFEQFTVHSHGLTLGLQLGHAFRPGEQQTIEALVAAFATALDRNRLDVEARQQRVRADLDHSRAGFLTAVTHDLRTPIATIKAATGALLGPAPTLDDRERRELLEAVHAESARLEGLVTKVLELTRIRAGIRPERSLVAAADLVQAAVDRLGPVAHARTIALDIDPDLPALRVDPLLLEHVVTNLLENAIRHDPTAGDIVVWARASGDMLELAISDHGPGIAAADRARAFDEFVRLDKATDGPGTGLGLAIVRALTEANDGEVRYEDTPGGGATFVLVLPIQPNDEGGLP